jgi:exodeoxyribonuclease VII small subunit
MTDPTPCGDATFEQALGELEQIVRQLEEGNIGLADSLAKYEQGVKRLKECYGLLERAERRIELLDRVDADGQAITKPFADEATIDKHAKKAVSAYESAEADAETSSARAPKAKIRSSRPLASEPDGAPGLF